MLELLPVVVFVGVATMLLGTTLGELATTGGDLRGGQCLCAVRG